MEIPKVLWCKNNMAPEDFKRCQFFDLPDFRMSFIFFKILHTDRLLLLYIVTYLATSSWTRSSCSLACKCSYVPDPATLPPNSPHLDPSSPASDPNPPVGWQPAFFKSIGLQSIVVDNFSQLGGPAPYPSAGIQPGHSARTHESENSDGGT